MTTRRSMLTFTCSVASALRTASDGSFASRSGEIVEIGAITLALEQRTERTGRQ